MIFYTIEFQSHLTSISNFLLQTQDLTLNHFPFPHRPSTLIVTLSLSTLLFCGTQYLTVFFNCRIVLLFTLLFVDFFLCSINYMSSVLYKLLIHLFSVFFCLFVCLFFIQCTCVCVVLYVLFVKGSTFTGLAFCVPLSFDKNG